MAEQEITEEQAAAALQQLISTDNGSEGQIDTEPEETSNEPEGEVEIEAPPDDDVDSLRNRMAELEAKIEEEKAAYQARLQALTNRNQENEKILRERYLRKSTATDRALKALEAARSGDGISEAEVERVISEIRGTQNPASASYAPPPQEMTTNEDQALELNAFLNEKGMTDQEASAFGDWLRGEANVSMPPAEQAVANQSLGGFLRLAHFRWEQGRQQKEAQTKRDTAVDAVKTVQKVQREAARAASGSTTAPRKQPAGSKKGIDVSKLTPNDISELVKLSVTEQYD